MFAILSFIGNCYVRESGVESMNFKGFITEINSYYRWKPQVLADRLDMMYHISSAMASGSQLPSSFQGNAEELSEKWLISCSVSGADEGGESLHRRLLDRKIWRMT